LKNFFMIHPNKIARFPRFSSLWEKRGRDWHKIKDDINPGKFSPQEYRDLQVLYHLSWCGWKLQENPEIEKLMVKGAAFSEEEKKILLDIQKEFLKEIIPFYKRLKEENRIEISTSPFYHPILPLLVDQKTASKSTPGIPLPGRTLQLGSDAEAQLNNGLQYFKDTLGFPAKGIWPSEGSVSDEALRIAASNGLNWAATDDEILRKSTGKNKNDLATDDFLTPYEFAIGDKRITIFFRNHYLSDRLGFTYSRMKPELAADDFISNLKWIRDNSKSEHPLVCIILDGENAWEFFPDNGRQFLQKLTASLQDADWIETETFSGYLERFGQNLPQLNAIHPGSWIYGNFTTWIGHPEKNKAWELLLKTREEAERFLQDAAFAEKIKDQIRNEIYITEGSDWFWWYGDDHRTEFAAEFDAAFRQHLINVYLLAGKEAPKELFESVLEARSYSGVTEPVSFISPVMNGLNGSFFEWRGSGSYNPNVSQGAIHRTNFCIKQVKFGFNTDYLYLRIQTAPQSAEQVLQNNLLEICFADPLKALIQIRTGSPPQLFQNGVEEGYNTDDLIFKCSHTVEMGIKWRLLGLKSGEKAEFNIVLKENGETIERHPANTNILVTVPDSSFEERNWIV
jgi:alpha-amylase/alpha-mannosidase (GH57 family)